MTGWAKRLSLLAGLCLPLAGAHAQSGIAATELGRGVTMFVFPSGGNVVAAAASDGIVMVDAQYAPNSRGIKAAIAERSKAPIRCVVNTHYHIDHTSGNADFAAVGAIVASHEQLRARLVGGLEQTGLPTLTYRTGVTLRLNGLTAEVTHPDPAHTDGDSFVYFREANVLATGDLYFTYRYPNIDVPAGGNIDGMIAAVNAMLAKIDDQTKVVPGHGRLSNKKELTDYRDMLVRARALVLPYVQSGKSENETYNAKPLAELDRIYLDDNVFAQRFVRFVYQSLKR